ncbi:MAG: hypothetical protein HFE63_02555 [Clostridiales bacterium]|nr:hypothetical protein [Clostridiales bacterium]
MPETDNKPTNKGDEITSLDETKIYLPEAQDFNDYEFTAIAQNSNTRQNFYIEELSGDVINDALYQRDIAVCERLNIKFNFVSETDRGTVTNKVKSAVLADDEAYDLVINSLSDGMNMLTASGLLYDLKNIPYLTLDSELWNSSMLDNMTMGGKLYFTTGSLSATYYKTPIVMAMNQRVAKNYNIDDIYETVLSGKWTVDLLHKLTADISQDLDNNSKMDENDFYGLAFDGTFGNVLFNSSGVDSVENGMLAIDSERAVSVVQKLSSLFGNRDIYFNDKIGTGISADIFRNGNALFTTYTITGIVSGFRDMEDDFAIIPSPKYEESQDKYYTTCNTWLPSGIGVPMNCSDPSRTGLIMETMAYYSNQYVAPAVYETTLRGKVARDDSSSIMLDIIYENAYFDLVTAMNLNETATLLRDCALGEKENYVSEYQKIKNGAQDALDKIIEGVN